MEMIFWSPVVERLRCVCVCVCVCVVCVLRVLSDWTLGAAAYPSKKLAISVRHHTKVLAGGGR